MPFRDPPPAPEGRHYRTKPKGPTKRQIEIFLLTIEHGQREAAQRLGISPHTVSNQLKNLYRRVGALSRSHAVWILWPTYGDALSRLSFVRDVDRKLKLRS